MTERPGTIHHADGRTRCWWCGEDPLYMAYHDTEWGVPMRDEDRMFEFLSLEGFQAGLSWITILRKRENFRRAFDGFDAEKVARYTDADQVRLLADAGIVRNKAKCLAAVNNARATLALREEGPGLAGYLWSFVDGQPIVNRYAHIADVPAHTPLAETISKDMKKRGFRFVGPTVIYAHMQAVGMVNDHLIDCDRHGEVGR